MDIEDSARLFPQWKELAKIASLWEYGSMHSHAEISAILGIEKQTSAYYQAVTKANTVLTVIGKRLANVQGSGYAVAKPGGYVEISQEQKNRGLRHYRVAAFVTGNAPTEKMTDHERIVHDRHHFLNVSTVTMLEKEQKKSMITLKSPLQTLLSKGVEENEGT